MCFNHYIGVIIALFDPERIVYLTNSLVDEGRKNVVALVAANIYTTTTCLTTRDHLTIHPIEPIHISRRGLSGWKIQLPGGFFKNTDIPI